MALKLIEGVIDDVTTYLSDNMVAKLDALDAEYDDFTLDDIKDYYVTELSEVPEQPAIFIIGERSDVRAEGPDYAELRHRIIIACLATDQDKERLRRRLYRYVRAVFELIRDSRATYNWVVLPEALDFSPMYAAGSTFLADARLIVNISRVEAE